MAETPRRELQPASQNPWYMLATAGEDHTYNTRRWNGYMRHLIGEEAAAKLKRGDGTPRVLPILSPDEIECIAAHLPFPRRLPSMISQSGIYLSGLLFAEAVDFQDFYFPVSVDFRGSTFAKYAIFEKSTFAEEARFAGSTFAEYANFAGSTFAGPTDFEKSTFTDYANFEKSTFAGNANFEKSTFAKYAIFEKSSFAKYAIFAGSTFAGPARFTGSSFAGYADFAGPTTFAGYAAFENVTFKGLTTFARSSFAGKADFSNAKYEGKTSFQNVIFTRAPLFFETTLHEDTDWTGITWPAKPADKDAATQYVRRYDRLALIMSTLKQPDNEHQFFRLSMRAKEVRDGWGISTFSSYLYGLLFRYGWGFERALGLWVAHLVLGAGYLWGMALWQMSQPLSGLKALAISFSNSLPFLGLQRGPVESAYACFDTLTGFNITYACSDTLTGFDMLWTIQSVSGPLLLFFLLLTIRNRFRLR